MINIDLSTVRYLLHKSMAKNLVISSFYLVYCHFFSRHSLPVMANLLSLHVKNCSFVLLLKLANSITAVALLKTVQSLRFQLLIFILNYRFHLELTKFYCFSLLTHLQHAVYNCVCCRGWTNHLHSPHRKLNSLLNYRYVSWFTLIYSTVG